MSLPQLKNKTFEWALVIVSNSVFYPTDDAILKGKKIKKFILRNQP